MKKALVCLIAALSCQLFAGEEAQEKQQPDINKLSEAFGHMIGQNLESLGFNFDMDKVLMGLKDEIAGKASPLSESETVEAITHLQEAQFQHQSQENLTNAEEFLAKNAKEQNVVQIEEGKLQYVVNNEGTGAEVQPHFSPLIRYVGRFIDGNEFGSSQEDEVISLDETIPGFSKGLLGMKEGEKRTLYIHPELGYGVSGFLPPNSLLVFDIEIVKANAPQQDEMLSTSPSDGQTGEIASFPDFNDDQLPAVR